MNDKERHEKLMQRAIAMCIKIDKLEAENAELREKIKHLRNVDWINSENARLRRCLVSQIALNEEIASWKARWAKIEELPRWSMGIILNVGHCMILNPTGKYVEFEDVKTLESGDSEDISLCKSCGCMTHSLFSTLCGKCGKIKPYGSEGDKK